MLDFEISLPAAAEPVACKINPVGVAQDSTQPMQGVECGQGMPSRVSMENLLNAAEPYFSPKPFESEALYRRLGVGVFMRLSPSDWLARRANEGSLLEVEGTRKERLTELERSTRYLEAMHVGMLAVMTTELGFMGGFSSPGLAALTVGSQIVGNVYPIMLQRQNRLRTRRILGRMSRKPA